jgi:hypothetical protein
MQCTCLYRDTRIQKTDDRYTSADLHELSASPAHQDDEFLGSLLLNLSSQDASHLSVCARRLRLFQDASEQSQEMVRDGNARLAEGRPPLSIAASLGWRSARLGGELGALRVTSWLRLGIPGNVLCMPMQWIRTNAQLSPACLACCKGVSSLPVVSSSRVFSIRQTLTF